MVKCPWCNEWEGPPSEYSDHLQYCKKYPPHYEAMKEQARVRSIEGRSSSPIALERTKEPGMCYVEAYRFILKEGDYLIHGKITSPADKRVINHAWVEFETGWIWEPQTEKFMRKSEFEQIFQPKVEAKYTPKEAAMLALKSKHYGPWHSEIEEEYSKQTFRERLPWQTWIQPILEYVTDKSIKEGWVKTEDIYREWIERGVTREEIDKVLGQLIREGTLYEPREGFLRKT